MSKTKYSYEEKLKAVMKVLKEHRSNQYVATEIGCNRKAISLWVFKYKRFGTDGLKIKRNKTYTQEFKLTVVRDMKENHLTLFQAANKFAVVNPTNLLRWKKKYESQGECCFMEEKEKDLKKEKKRRKLEGKTKEELIKKVEYLEVENAYLKKLHDLVQQKEALENEKKAKSSKN